MKGVINLFSENLKRLRNISKISQKKLSEQLYVSQQTIAKWETDKSTPNPEMLNNIASYFNVSVDFLLGREDLTISNIKGIKVPVYGSVAAGIPIEAIQDIIDYEEVDKETAKKGELFGLKIKGQSMEPRICDGDVVIVLRQDFIEDGQTGIIMVNGDEATCKKVKFSEAGITLISNNPAYEPMFYTKEEIETLPVRVLGKVIELRGKL